MPHIDGEYYDNISSYWVSQGINMARQEQQDRRQAEHDRESYYCDLCGKEIFRESDVFAYEGEYLCQNCFEALEMDMEAI